MKGRLLFTVYFITLNCLLAQKQINNWHFGTNGAISFSSGIPVALSNSAMDQFEGSASVSDATGELLFYTDGVTVWNKKNGPMQNGTGLQGDLSTTQSAMILPMPGNSSVYYIFCADDNGQENGLTYSIVDMSAEYGLGAVVKKNIQLQPFIAEKMTATYHVNGKDYWVIVHGVNNSKFYSFRLHSGGVDTIPVVSSTGSLHEDYDGAVGYMKISPSGKKLAVAVSNQYTLELFDFDNSTGEVTNPLCLKDYTTFYGLEFSPDESKLYLSDWASGTIYQLDLNVENIMKSIMPVAFSVNGIGGLQRGPDNRIYVSRSYSSYVGVINFPNKRGNECDYVDDGISLGQSSCKWGLPNFPPTVFSAVNMGFTVNKQCVGEKVEFECNLPFMPDSLFWDFGDGVASSSGLSLKAFHTYAAAGDFNAGITAYTGGKKHTFFKTVSIHPLPTAAISGKSRICRGDSTQLIASGGLAYSWSNGSVCAQNMVRPYSDSTFEVTVTGLYCSATASLRVIPVPHPAAPAAVGSEACENSMAKLIAYDAEGIINWYADKDGNTLLKENSKEYSPETGSAGNFTFYCASEREGCVSARVPVELKVRPKPEITVSAPEEMLVKDNSIELKALPAGGVFKGKGVKGVLFDPAVAGEGEHTVTYTVKDKYSCSNTQSFSLRVKGCCGFYSGFFKMDVYPNPGNGLFKVCPGSELALALQMKFTALNIYDSSGNLVFSEGNLSKQIQDEILDLRGLSNGVYLLQLVTLDEVIARKLTINR